MLNAISECCVRFKRSILLFYRFGGYVVPFISISVKDATERINAQKRNKHPKQFFSDPQTASYFSQYDFLPDQDSTLWDDPGQSIARRKGEMLQFMQTRYGLTVTPTP